MYFHYEATILSSHFLHITQRTREAASSTQQPYTTEHAIQVSTTVTERVHVVTTTPYMKTKHPEHIEDPIVELIEGDDEDGSGSGDNWNSDDEDYDYREGSGGGREDTSYDNGNNDNVATGNVSSLSQEEMERIR